jgi:hypothetical protein
MKRKEFLTGIINLMLIFGLVLTGCDTGTDVRTDLFPYADD